jgi:hypothetical protein
LHPEQSPHTSSDVQNWPKGQCACCAREQSGSSFNQGAQIRKWQGDAELLHQDEVLPGNNKKHLQRKGCVCIIAVGEEPGNKMMIAVPSPG